MVKALDTKFNGIGKPFEKSDWDYLLGNYMVKFHFSGI
jgi:hypothetical protein